MERRTNSFLRVLLALTIVLLIAGTAVGEDAKSPTISAGLGGFKIASADGDYSFTLAGFTQGRWTINAREPSDPSEKAVQSGFMFNRTRLIMKGHLSDFGYFLQLNINNEGALNIQTAKASYTINDHWSIAGGKFGGYVSREDWQSPKDLLTSDYSANDHVFAFYTAYGGTSTYQADKTRLYLTLTNGFGGAHENFGDSSDPASQQISLYGRWEYQFVDSDWGIWNDLISRRGRDFGVLLGLSGGYHHSWANDNSNNVSSYGQDNGQANIDLSINGSGYQIMVAGVWNYLLNATSAAPSYNNWGLMVQGGVFVAPKHQLFAQYNLVTPGSDKDGYGDYNSITVGYNFLPFEETNNWKFTAEAGYLFNSIDDSLVSPSSSLGYYASDEGQVYGRLQAQIGF